MKIEQKKWRFLISFSRFLIVFFSYTATVKCFENSRLLALDFLLSSSSSSSSTTSSSSNFTDLEGGGGGVEDVVETGELFWDLGDFGFGDLDGVKGVNGVDGGLFGDIEEMAFELVVVELFDRLLPKTARALWYNWKDAEEVLFWWYSASWVLRWALKLHERANFLWQMSQLNGLSPAII